MAAENRERVIIESKRLFYQYGFRHITMEEIATNLRISKRTLYSLFPTKESLVHVVVLDIMAPKMIRIRHLMQESDTATQFFVDIIALLYSLGREISEPMMSDIKMMPNLQKEIEENRLELLSYIRSTIEYGKHTGDIRSDLNVDIFR